MQWNKLSTGLKTCTDDDHFPIVLFIFNNNNVCIQLLDKVRYPLLTEPLIVSSVKVKKKTADNHVFTNLLDIVMMYILS